jgi:hypothetical protein
MSASILIISLEETKKLLIKSWSLKNFVQFAENIPSIRK